MLEQVRGCAIQFVEDTVRISGVCKRTHLPRLVIITRAQWEAWKGGYPIERVAPTLTRTEIGFLKTGIWEP